MRFKKNSPLFAALFLGLVLFAKPLFQSSLGFVAKRICSSQLGSKLTYRSVKWSQGKLVFSALSLSSPDFHCTADQASFSPDFHGFSRVDGHLEIDRPHLVLRQLPSWQGERGSLPHLTAVIRKGTVDFGMGGAVASFSFEKIKPGQIGHLTLDWGDSSVVLDGERRGETLQVKADFHRFKAPLLNSLHSYPPVEEGFLTGPIAVSFRGEEIEKVSLNLSVDQLEVGPLKDMKGTLSYHTDIGSKWEFEGLGNEIPMSGWGRSSFANDWLDSEWHLDKGHYRLKKEALVWSGQWKNVFSPQVQVFREMALLFYPEWSSIDGHCEQLSGEGSWTFSEEGIASWGGRFVADSMDFRREKIQVGAQKIEGHFSGQEGGSLTWESGDLLGIDLPQGKLTGFLSDWLGEIGPVTLWGKGVVCPDFDLAYQMGGEWKSAGGAIPFYGANLSRKEGEWAFDVRFLRKTWDFLRLAGQTEGDTVVLNGKSHFLGNPFSESQIGADRFSLAVPLEWRSLLAAEPLFRDFGLPAFGQLPCRGEVDLQLLIARGNRELTLKGHDFYWKEELLPLEFHGVESEGEWNVDRLQLSDLDLSFRLRGDRIEKGKAKWKEGSSGEFHGKLSCDPSLPFRCELSLPTLKLDFADFPQSKMEGHVEGQGHLIYDEIAEADFDLKASSLKILDVAVENKKPLHFHYSSELGATLHGIDCQGPFNFKTDFLTYHAGQYSFENMKAFIPGEFFTHPLLQVLDREEALSLSGNLTVRDDFTHLECSLEKGVVPFGGQLHQIRDLELSWDEIFCHTQFVYSHLGHSVPISLRLDLDQQISGSLSLGDGATPLSVDWEYKSDTGLCLHQIQGTFAGVEASFFPDVPQTLVGRASIDFKTLSEFLPPKGAEVFQELKMGAGFELKGRLNIEKNLPYFRGILSGKECELFGYQLQTLFAQVDLRPDFIRIFDFKSSDKGGSILSPEIVMQSKDGAPWTIDIPTLSILDLRPCLLRQKGNPLGSIRPLVVRELKMTDFKGLLDDGKTYTAHGNLYFINTFKRERTFFDIPADFFSRIFGLDLELLIPVCGTVEFELKDGFFHLTELTDAFSENKRSEFFLEGHPVMDLDGNIDIFIKMKQYVLFKFTQPFLISIDGKLDDPQFHLRGK